MLPTASKKSTVIAMEEARRGLVKYEIQSDIVLVKTFHPLNRSDREGHAYRSRRKRGIAAYKAAEIVRLLMQNGHEVRVTLTAGAEEFIRPLTLPPSRAVRC